MQKGFLIQNMEHLLGFGLGGRSGRCRLFRHRSRSCSSSFQGIPLSEVGIKETTSRLDVSRKVRQEDAFLEFREENVLPSGVVMIEEARCNAQPRPDKLRVLTLLYLAEHLRDAVEHLVVPLRNKFPEVEQRQLHLLPVHLAVDIMFPEPARLLEHLLVKDPKSGKINVILHNDSAACKGYRPRMS